MQDEHSDISFYGTYGPDLSQFPAFDIIRNVDLQTRIIIWSENYYTYLGYSRPDVPANDQNWVNSIFPPDKQMVIDSLNLAIRDKKTIWSADYRFLKASGEVIEITDRCFIFYDDQLKPVRLMGTMQDISSIREALRRVQEVEEQYRNLFERASDAIVIHDVVGKLYNVNQAAADFSGYSRAEMLQMKVADFLLPSELIDAPEAVQELRAGKTSYRVRRIRLRTGLHKIAEVSSRMLPDGKIQAILRDITDKTESELALVASEYRFRTLAEHAPVGIFETNLIGDIIYVNEKITEYTGASRDELMGQSWIKFIHKDDRDFIPEEWKLLKDLRQDSRKEIRFLHKSGAIVWTQAKTIPLLGKNGEPEGFMGTVTDITAEKLALESVRHSEEKFRTLVEQASDGIIIGDSKGRIIMANSAACFLSHFSEEELLQKTITELTDPEDLKKNPFQFSAMMEPGGARTERKLKMKDGSLRNVEISARFLSDNQRFIAFVHDITHRKKRDDELRLSNERFRLIATATNDMVWDWDIANNKTWWNDNFYIHMGYERLEFDSNLNAWYDGLHPDDRDKTWSGLKKALAEKNKYWTAEYRFIKASGEVVNIFDRGYILYNESGEAYRVVGSMLDITERMKSVERNRISNERLRAAEVLGKTGYWEWHVKTNKVNWSPGTYLVYDEVESGFTGEFSDFMNRVHPDDQRGLNNIIRWVMETGHSVGYDFRIITKSGETRYIQTNAIAEKDEAGNLVSIFGNARDQTENKLSEIQVKKEKELSDSVINSLPGIFYCCDEQGRFLRWNHEMEKVTGYTPIEILQMSPTEFFRGAEKDYILEKIRLVFETGSADAEVLFYAKNGTSRPYYFKATRSIYEGKPCLLGTGIDITDRKAAESKLEESYRDIRKLTAHLQHIREEERSHIAREIHDELGQQLTVLKMDISWLNKRLGEDAESAVKKKMRELLEMLDGTVKTVRRISSELRPSMLDDLGLVATMEWQMGEFQKRTGIKTKMKATETDLHLSADNTTGLFRIFQESLTNVARHAGASEVMIILEMEGNHVELSIRDNGVGFEMQQARNKKTLGILGMRERAHLMGGDYNLHSVPGEGTIVKVRLPAGNNKKNKKS